MHCPSPEQSMIARHPESQTMTMITYILTKRHRNTIHLFSTPFKDDLIEHYRSENIHKCLSPAGREWASDVKADRRPGCLVVLTKFSEHPQFLMS